MIITIGSGTPMMIQPSLTDATMWAELRQQCDAVTGPIVFELLDLPHWPAEPRWATLGLLQYLRPRGVVRNNGDEYGDPFEGVLAAMTGPSDMIAHTNSLQAAIEAAALFHPIFPKTAAGRINNRIAELGGTKHGIGELTKTIKALGESSADNDDDAAGEDGALDAKRAAEHYIEVLHHTCHVPNPERPVLLFFRSDFYVWGGRAWTRVAEDRLRARVVGFLQKQGHEKITRSFIEDVLTNLKGLCLLDCWDEALPFVIRSQTPTDIKKHRFLVFRNGMLDLDHFIKTGKYRFRQHDSRYFNTLELDFDFDSTARCPKWRTFMNQVLPRTGPGDKRQSVVQQFMGYSLIPDCRFEKALALVGGGRNGKSTTMRSWEGLLSATNVGNVPVEQLGQDHQLNTLVDKAVNFSRDLSHLSKVDEGRIKQLVSGEPITVNRKYKEALSIVITAKLVIAANELPDITDPTNGMWRRWIFLPFEVAIPEHMVNENLAAELMAELPGILIWTLRGLRRLLRRRRFPNCRKCAALLKHHRTESDSVREFFSECCRTSDGCEVYTLRLYELYAFYCVTTGRKAVKANVFGRRLRPLGFTKRRGSEDADGSRPWVYAPLRLTATGTEWAKRLKYEKHPHWEDVQYILSAPHGVHSGQA